MPPLLRLRLRSKRGRTRRHHSKGSLGRSLLRPPHPPSRNHPDRRASYRPKEFQERAEKRVTRRADKKRTKRPLRNATQQRCPQRNCVQRCQCQSVAMEVFIGGFGVAATLIHQAKIEGLLPAVSPSRTYCAMPSRKNYPSLERG